MTPYRLCQIKDYGTKRECSNSHHVIDNSDVRYLTNGLGSLLVYNLSLPIQSSEIICQQKCEATEPYWLQHLIMMTGYTMYIQKSFQVPRKMIRLLRLLN